MSSNVPLKSSFKQKVCVLWDASVILDMLHPFFVSKPVSVFSFGSAHSNVLDVLPQQKGVRLVMSYQRLQPLSLVQALPVILRPYLQPSVDR